MLALETSCNLSNVSGFNGTNAECDTMNVGINTLVKNTNNIFASPHWRAILSSFKFILIISLPFQVSSSSSIELLREHCFRTVRTTSLCQVSTFNCQILSSATPTYYKIIRSPSPFLIANIAHCTLQNFPHFTCYSIR